MHKYDLTPDCTHLIVGDYNTPKYRHVAKERPDIKAMAAGWVEAVRNLWVQDADIDFAALEREWQLRPFETGGGEPTPDGALSPRRRLLCCMTGFEDPDVRQRIVDLIESNGGLYTGDLTKRVTHLVVCRPEGRKYQAAKNWGVQTVSVEWVHDSIERGLILDEKCYDPVLPPEERGLGAWNRQRAQRLAASAKRPREKSAAAQDEGQRKLRKTASMRLNSQRDNLWGDILGKPQASEPPPAAVSQEAPGRPAAEHAVPAAASAAPSRPSQPPAGPRSAETQGSKLSSFGMPDDGAVFASCCFYVHGFSPRKTEILVNTIASLGGLICHSLDEVVSTSGAQLAHRFLIVPQTSAPETHPSLPDNVHIVTEFYIERCLHKKYFFDPAQHVIGRPFPLFPIPGFEQLSICTAGFTGVDLNQVDKSVRQLGARYEERFTANISLLVCPSLSVVRKQKLELALAWKVPVVRADWLWECISTGFNVPIKRFMFPELKQNLDGPKLTAQAEEKGEGAARSTTKGRQDKTSINQTTIDKDLLPKPAAKPTRRRDLDTSAFAPAKEDSERPARSSSSQQHRNRRAPATEHDSNATTTTHFETARTRLAPTDDGNTSFANRSPGGQPGPPLAETSSNSLNKSPPPSRNQDPPRQRRPLSRIASEVADSEATDGDVGQPGDIALQEGHENENDENNNAGAGANQDQQEEPDEAARQRLEAEEKAAQERRALSSKLVSSLLDSAAAPLAHQTTTTATTTTTTTGTIAAATTAAADGSEESRPPRRRKREILGRAVSNVSAASSTTSATGGGGGGGGEAAAAAPTAGAGTKDPPAATQLEYEDPEAQRYKAELMSKMLGTVAGGAHALQQQQQKRREKLTLAEMGGYDVPSREEDGYALGGRRTRRR